MRFKIVKGEKCSTNNCQDQANVSPKYSLQILSSVHKIRKDNKDKGTMHNNIRIFAVHAGKAGLIMLDAAT